tara:strand:+ start:1401 stop:2069 length:669 start_codon:yes stop_codon:yes gene_type:complete
MKEYIFEKVRDTTKFFKFGNIPVEEIDPLPENINLSAIFKALEQNLPPHYFNGLEGVVIHHSKEFDEREVNAVYRDNKFYITNQQDNTRDLMDDLVHEFAHHMEVIFPEKIYADQSLIKEFEMKRQQLKFELQSEGYWVSEYDFNNLKYDSSFDKFLYKRVGPSMLRMTTTGMFIRPYAAVSLREYFATGFEAYYLGQQESLKKISPALFKKITELHDSRQN